MEDDCGRLKELIEARELQNKEAMKLHLEVDKLKDLIEEERRLLHIDFKNLKGQEDELDSRLRTEIDIRLRRIQKLKHDLQDL